MNPSTGLTVVGARECDPDTGRFVTDDPLLEQTDATQLNGYAYAGNNPVVHSDPSGLREDGDRTGCAPGNGGACNGQTAPASAPSSTGHGSGSAGGGCQTDNACNLDSNERGCNDSACPKSGHFSCQDAAAGITGSIGGSVACPSADTKVTYKSLGKPSAWCVPFPGAHRCDDYFDARNDAYYWLALSCATPGQNTSMSCPLIKHYYGASGDDWKIDVDDLLKTPEFSDGVDRSVGTVALKAFSKCAKPPCSYTFDTGWKAMAFSHDQSQDYYYGYRGMTYQVVGSVSVSGNGHESMSYRVNAFKAWNFDPNETLRGVSFRGAANAAGFGMAREFAVVGTSSQQVG